MLNRQKIVACTTLIATAALLSGCQTEQNMEAGIKSFKGKPYEYAFSVMGVPDSEKSIAGRRVFTWETRSSGSYSMPTVNNSTAYVNGNAIHVRTQGSETLFYQNDCKVVIMVNGAGIVERSQYEGNRGGCAYWGKRFSEKAS